MIDHPITRKHQYGDTARPHTRTAVHSSRQHKFQQQRGQRAVWAREFIKYREVIVSVEAQGTAR